MIAGQRFDQRGRPGRIDRFVKQDTGTLVEYGLREDATLLLMLGQRTEALLVDGDPHRVLTSGIGGGARIALWRNDNAVVSLQAAAMTGLERSMPALPRRFGARHEADLRLLAGHGFEIGGVSAFVEAQAGYRWRSTRRGDEVRIDLTLGVRPMPRLLLLLQSLNSVAVQGEGAAPRSRPRQHKLQASAVFDLTETWSVQAGVFASVAGRDSLSERGVHLGLWRKF